MSTKDLTKRLNAFAKEAMLDNAAFSRLGQDDNSYDALALANIAKAMVVGLKAGTTPADYATYAGPSPEGMEDLLEMPLTPEVAEAWLKMATEALSDIS
jgi:hypothetical protein